MKVTLLFPTTEDFNRDYLSTVSVISECFYSEIDCVIIVNKHNHKTTTTSCVRETVQILRKLDEVHSDFLECNKITEYPFTQYNDGECCKMFYKFSE